MYFYYFKPIMMATVVHLVHDYHFTDELPPVLEEPRIPYNALSKRTRSRFANLMLDTAFKVVFGLPACEQTLIELLEALLPSKKIQSIQYLDKEIPGFFMEERKTVFDLFCKGDNEEKFIIEMQLNAQKHFQDRVLFYSTFPLREQLITPLEEQRLRNSGKRRKIKDYHLIPVYVISIINFKLEHGQDSSLRDGILSSYSLRNDLGGELMTDALHFLFLELPRLAYNKDEAFRCKTLLEKIAFVFRHSSFLEERPVEFSEDLFKRIFQAAEVANMTSEQFHQYQKDMTTAIDLIAQRDYAHEEGFNEGIIEGMKEGNKKGREEGMSLERDRIIRRLRDRGMTPEQIHEIVGG